MRIDKKLNNCLVITNYRTGSTNFCMDNARQNNLQNHFEIINGERYHLQNAIEMLKTSNKWIAKVMPDQFDYNMNILEQFLENTTEIVYLYRKDYVAQCKSWIAMQHLQDWGVKPQTGDYIQQKVFIDQAFADKHSQVIRDNNDFLKECVKKYPADVYAYEDIQNGKPYKRLYDWQYEPYIKPYNTEEMFNEVGV